MLKLFYTTIEAQDIEQVRASLSLGGYKASNQVLNDDFGNLFGEITPLSIDKNRDHYIALILKNDDIIAKTGVKFWFDRPEGSYATFEIAAVVLATDANSFKYMENVQTIYTRPMYSTFVSAEGVDNAVTIGDMAAGEMIGLWIKRGLDLVAIETDHTTLFTKNQTTKQYEERVLEQVETVDFVLDWD